MNRPHTNPIAWQIDPLPDFLLDHTLTEERWPARLREVVSRWVQFVGALWRWHDRARFAIRFTSDGDRVRAFVLADSDEPGGNMLRDDLEVLFRSHGLPVQAFRGGDATDPRSPHWDLGGDVVFGEVRQHENTRLWSVPQRLVSTPKLRKELDWLPERYWQTAPTLFPWWAPGGPFLLPIEKLISQPGPCSLTAYLAPTVLTRREWAWLAFVARTAQSVGDIQEQAIGQAMAQRRVDPAASLAGRLAMANLRRLSDKPFLVNVQCAAGRNAGGSVRSLAGTIESIVFEAPFDRPSQEDNRLPSAADVRLAEPATGGSPERAFAQQYAELRVPEPAEPDPLWRMPYLADARGASTVFRLPVNVRGGVPGFRVSQRPPDFHPGPRRSSLADDHVLIGELHQGGVASVHRDQFTKHALVTGFTGSGKTVTVMSLAHQLHAAGVPVLVIESAKHEYRALLDVPDFADPDQPLWVFTAGNEGCAPLRINPFELLPGVRVEAHISRLQTCFEAALPPIGPLSSMIGEALIDVYERLGWRLTDLGPEVGDVMRLRFPSIRDFYGRMSEIVDERGYDGDVRSNVTAAVLGRIRPLTVGTKGLIFRNDQDLSVGQPRRASLVSELFARSTVIELNDLNLDDKALVTMFLLTFLREYRERHASTDGRLIHATVVEEAHNVLENVASRGNTEGGGADTRYKAVQAFSQLLSEIRALGQGLIIVDQSPEKLAPDALRNTNIQIAHQLRDSLDRDSIARAMIMETEQRDYLGKLSPGQAALFVTGLERATFVRVAPYEGRSPGATAAGRSQTVRRTAAPTPPSDAEIRDRMTAVTGGYRSGPYDRACAQCRVRLTCDHRPAVLSALADGALPDRFARVSDLYRRDRSTERCRTVHELVDLSVSAARTATDRADDAVVWCAFVHLWHRDRFNWTEPFPEFSFNTVRSVLKDQHPQIVGER